MLVGVLTLLVAAAIGDLRIGPELTPYQPLKLAVLGTLFATAALDPRWRRRLRFSYMAGWTLLVGYAAWGIATGRAAFTRHAGDIVRVSVAGLNENQQAILVATGMVVAFAELLRRPRSMRVMPWILALLAGGGVFVFSVSRGASVGLAAAAIFVFGSVAAGGRLRRGTLRALALASLCALGAVFASAPVASAANTLAERFAATVRQHEVGDRDRLAGEVLRLALREPWSGVGFGRTVHALGGDPHNSYLKIVAEGGAAAGLLLAGGLLAVAGVLARVRDQDRDLGAAGALVLLLVVGLVGQALLRPPFWFFLAITSAAVPGRGRG
jgi:O-antigen ligase